MFSYVMTVWITKLWFSLKIQVDSLKLSVCLDASLLKIKLESTWPHLIGKCFMKFMLKIALFYASFFFYSVFIFYLDNDVLCAFGTSHVVTMLLPLIFAHLGPVATSDPRVSK